MYSSMENAPPSGGSTAKNVIPIPTIFIPYRVEYLAACRVLSMVCLDIAQRYELVFLEIGTDRDHVHFLVQSVPSYSPTKIVQIIKSLTAREIFHRVPTVKKRLWGGELWSKGPFISTVGRHGNEAVIRQYVRHQGSEKVYTQLHRQDLQLGLF